MANYPSVYLLNSSFACGGRPQPKHKSSGKQSKEKLEFGIC